MDRVEQSTEFDQREPLAEEQVATLPEGTPITVIWSGGNGPHDYVVTVDRWGKRHAATDPDNERMRFYNPLNFTGLQQFHTRVWLRPPPGVGDQQ